MLGPTLEQSQDMYEAIRLYNCGSKSFDEMCRTSFELIALQYSPGYALGLIRVRPQKLTDDPDLRRTIEQYFSEISEALADAHTDDIPRIIQDMYTTLTTSPAEVSMPPYFAFHPFAREIAKRRLGFRNPDIMVANDESSATIDELREKMFGFDVGRHVAHVARGAPAGRSPEILRLVMNGLGALSQYLESAGLDKASAELGETMSAIMHHSTQ